MATSTRRALGGWFLLSGGFSMLQAGSYTVQPVRIELSARQFRTTVQTRNLGNEPTTVQAHVVAWKAEGVEEVLSDSDDILLNPPIFTLAPGQVQSMRLGLRRLPSDAAEVTYRLILEEVPPPMPPGFMGVQPVLKISIPIFFKPKLPAAQLTWKVRRSANRDLSLSVENQGNAHVQIKQLSITAPGRPEPDFVTNTLTYVLRTGRKEWTIRDAQLTGSGRLVVQVRTDIGDLREVVVPDIP